MSNGSISGHEGLSAVAASSVPVGRDGRGPLLRCVDPYSKEGPTCELEYQVVARGLRLLDALQRNDAVIALWERPAHQLHPISVEPGTGPKQPPVLQGEGADPKGDVLGGEKDK